MSDETGIQPALTPEQWTQRYIGDAAATDEAISMGDGFDAVSFSGHQRHALAALALYGQPFGFTRADVAILEQAALVMENEDARGEPDTRAAAAYRTLAAKLAALLPPE